MIGARTSHTRWNLPVLRGLARKFPLLEWEHVTSIWPIKVPSASDMVMRKFTKYMAIVKFKHPSHARGSGWFKFKLAQDQPRSRAYITASAT